MKVEIVNGTYRISAAGGIVGSDTVPPSELATRYAPQTVDFWSEGILTEQGGTGVITRTVLRAGSEFFLVTEYDWYPDPGESHRESWETVTHISRFEAADILDRRIVSTQPLGGTNGIIIERASGIHEVVTPRGHHKGKSLPADSATFARCPEMVTTWTQEGEGKTTAYHLLSDGEKYALYVSHKDQETECDTILEMDLPELDRVFGSVPEVARVIASQHA